jgi:hypothetical protein
MLLIYVRGTVIETVEDEGTEFRRNVGKRSLIVATSEPRKKETSTTPLLNILTYLFISCTMGTGSFPGVKRPGRGADHPPPSSAEVKKE